MLHNFKDKAAGVNATIPVTMDISNDDAKFATLIENVGEFVAAMLDTQHKVFFDSHSTRCLNNRSHTFYDLIVEDGHATQTSLRVDNTYINSKRDAERMCEETTIIEETETFLKHAIPFCWEYTCLLKLLAEECDINRFDNFCIDLAPAVCSDPTGSERSDYQPEPTYFFTMSKEEVSIGGFAVKLAKSLEDKVEEWILACEHLINAKFGKGGIGKSPFYMDEREGQVIHIRKRLICFISSHLAMEGMFNKKGNFLGSFLNAGDLENLCMDVLDDYTRNACELMKTKSVADLQSLLVLCSNPKINPDSVAKHREAILRTTKFIPNVLKDLLASSTGNFHFDMLSNILRDYEHEPANSLLFSAQLMEWTLAVGREELNKLYHLVNEAIRIMKLQRLPVSGWIPTLRDMHPPLPTWTSQQGAKQALMAHKTTARTVLPKDQMYLSMPISTQKTLRLISLIWELTGHIDTHRAFFGPGHLLCTTVKSVIRVERVAAAHARETLMHWNEAASLGKNYRRAVLTLKNFNEEHGKLQTAVRVAASKLSNWSLSELLSITSESSTICQSNFSRIRRATELAPKTFKMVVKTDSLMRKVLNIVCPVLIKLRLDSRLPPEMPSTVLADLIRTIPKVRNYDGVSPELILTQEEVAGPSSDAAPGIDLRLRELSSSHTLCHYGRRPASEKAQWQQRRVYTLNGRDLRALLGMEPAVLVI